MTDESIEYWLRGPIEGIPALLQPAAHALLQARKEIGGLMVDFPGALLWQTPAGVASPGFHLQHIAGVIDRLFTYARGEQLSLQQLGYLSKEGKNDEKIATHFLVNQVHCQIDDAINGLKKIYANTLTDVRLVGRKKVVSTQAGLIFHAAEHTMRHLGQLRVTVIIILNEK